MAEAVAPSCPLCHGNEVDDFVEVDEKRYWRCSACLLTFLDPDCRLAPEAEYAHYLSHENEINDPGYRAFLSRLATPLLEQLPAVSSGLDYGCGPGPALAHMLREAGHAVALYDPFFAKDETVLSATYDFVTCTEVVEHLFDPAGEFKRFDQLLRPGGWLGIMTGFQADDDTFAAWHYHKDPTHVVFYKRETLEFVAAGFGWQFECPTEDVALMRKPH